MHQPVLLLCDKHKFPLCWEEGSDMQQWERVVCQQTGLGQWAIVMERVAIRSTPQVRARSPGLGAVQRAGSPHSED